MRESFESRIKELREDLERTIAEKAILENDLTTVTGDLVTANAKITRLESENDSLETRMATAETDITDLQNR